MKKVLVLIFVIMLATSRMYSQGCSDPGLCTVGILASDNTKDTVSSLNYEEASLDELLDARYLEDKLRGDLTFAIGFAERGVTNFQAIASFSARVRNRQMITIRAPFTSISGELGNINNVGDVTLSYQNLFKSGKDQGHSIIVGAVIPTNSANFMKEGQPLPMAYQTSLGVANLLAGISSTYKMFTLSLGYQHPLGANGNTFHVDNLNADPRDSLFSSYDLLLSRYQSSNQLKRGGDVVVRLEGHASIKKFKFYVSALPIWRLSNSQVKNTKGETIEVVGSKGLTLNYNLAFKYQFNENWLVRANYGQPLIQRAVVADGLVRASVTSVSIIYKRP